MKRNMIRLVLILASGGLLATAFQNCSPATFTSNEAGVAALKLETLPTKPGTGIETPVPNTDCAALGDGSCPTEPVPPPVPPSAPVADIECGPELQNALVAFDQLEATAEPKDAPRFEEDSIMGSKHYNEEYIDRIRRIFVKDELKVTTRFIDKIEELTAGSINVNAHSIRSELRRFAAGKVTVVAHTLPRLREFTAQKVCVSAHAMGEIKDMTSNISVYGRVENGKRATLEKLSHTAAAVSLYDVDVERIHHSASLPNTEFRLERSKVGRVSEGSATIRLISSSIEEIDMSFSGTIYVDKNSTVPAQIPPSVKLIPIE